MQTHSDCAGQSSCTLIDERSEYLGGGEKGMEFITSFEA